ncbi:hypothetical protein HDR61_01185 [bacterium]|nr:hypothetical protein [bacterium]
MQKLIKKMFTFASVLAAAVILTGCSNMCAQKKKHHHKPAKAQETVVVYQSYETTGDIDRVSAKMYTRSSHGGESKMGYIKFVETDNGLKMSVDLKDLRPGVTYTAKIYQCGSCNNDSMCCDKSPMPLELPKLMVKNAGRLEETFIIRGLTANQLNNAKIYLERDGGYKAAWGTFDRGMM